MGNQLSLPKIPKIIVFKGLSLIKIHGYICKNDKKQACRLSTCIKMESAMTHWEFCEIGESCDFLLCSFSGRALSHTILCPEPECNVCFFWCSYNSVEYPNEEEKDYVEKAKPNTFLERFKQLEENVDETIYQAVLFASRLSKWEEVIEELITDSMAFLTEFYIMNGQVAIAKKSMPNKPEFEVIKNILRANFNNILLVLHILGMPNPPTLEVKPEIIEKPKKTKKSKKSKKSEKPESPTETSSIGLRKRIQDRMILLLHAISCRKLKNVSCTLIACRGMKKVFRHMKTCQNEDSCEFLFCTSSAIILDHWTHCRSPVCLICLPEIQVEVQSGEFSLQKSDACTKKHSKNRQKKVEANQQSQPDTTQQLSTDMPAHDFIMALHPTLSQQGGKISMASYSNFKKNENCGQMTDRLKNKTKKRRGKSRLYKNYFRVKANKA